MPKNGGYPNIPCRPFRYNSYPLSSKDNPVVRLQGEGLLNKTRRCLLFIHRTLISLIVAYFIHIDEGQSNINNVKNNK